MMQLRICFDTCDKINFIGKIHNVTQDEMEFNSFHEFIVKIDKYLDMCGNPQSSFEKRTMVDNEVKQKFNPKIVAIRTIMELQHEFGKLKTYDLIIKTRSKADWQGVVCDEKGNRKSFETILELLDIFIN